MLKRIGVAAAMMICMSHSAKADIAADRKDVKVLECFQTFKDSAQFFVLYQANGLEGGVYFWGRAKKLSIDGTSTDTWEAKVEIEREPSAIRILRRGISSPMDLKVTESALGTTLRGVFGDHEDQRVTTLDSIACQWTDAMLRH